MAFSKSKKVFNEINITPLTDIFLVLLIIMMVIAPSFQSIDNDINIPEINSGVTVEQKNAEIALTSKGQFYINGKPVTADDLVKELSDLKPKLEKAEVVVKADTKAKSSEIQKIMKAAQEAEYGKLIIAGEPLTKKEQRKLDESSPAEKQDTQNVQNTVQKGSPSKTGIAPDEYNWDE